MSAVGSIFGVLGGCMGCMVFVESLAREEPSSMNLMTFSTFVFISVYGLVATSKFFTVPNKIPMRGYAVVVTTFFVVNVINNQALNFHVPVPLHIIFRSGSLLASLLLDVAWKKKSYPLRKYLSVFAITIGIIVCTLATGGKDNSGMSYEEASKHYMEWSIGICMLVFALFASAFLAIRQQEMYAQYGKHPDEAMFITHVASLPFFIFLWPDISRAMTIYSQSQPVVLAGVQLLPRFWMELLAMNFLQFLCIRFVYKLNATISALNVTMVVTLRKFLSLLFSIFYFQNPFTFAHWIGTAFVFVGTFTFSDVFFEQKKAAVVEAKNGVAKKTQ